jgi:hypothetical protein
MSHDLNKKISDMPCRYYLNGVCYLEERYTARVKDYKICNPGKCVLHDLNKIAMEKAIETRNKDLKGNSGQDART